MSEKKYINEKIVGREESPRRRIRHYLRVVLSAVLFGCISAGAFAASEPLLASFLRKEEAESIEFETEPVQESTEAETAVPAETETEALAEVVQSEIENYNFSVSSYETLMNSLKQLVSEAEKSLVEVKKSVSSRDFLGEEYASEDSYSGMVLAVSGSEVLILTPLEAADNPDALEVTIQREKSYPAMVKARDSRDRLAVVSVALSALSEKEKKSLQEIPLGNSRLLQRGDTVAVIGAPAGKLNSSVFSSVAYLSYNETATDRTVEDITLTGQCEAAHGSFVLNTRGELVGWVESGTESADGFCRIAGISDYLKDIESLSNGREVSFLGLQVQEVNGELEAQGIPAGVYVHGTEENSPAYVAGIQSGDVLVRINEQEVKTVSAYENALENTAVNDTITVTVLRQRGQEYTELPFTVTVGAR